MRLLDCHLLWREKPGRVARPNPGSAFSEQLTATRPTSLSTRTAENGAKQNAYSSRGNERRQWMFAGIFFDTDQGGQRPFKGRRQRTAGAFDFVGDRIKCGRRSGLGCLDCLVSGLCKLVHEVVLVEVAGNPCFSHESSPRLRTAK